MARRDIEFIHILRGLAPLLVLISHLGGAWLYTRVEVTWSYTWWYVNVVLPLHLYQGGGHLGVVIFFFISGFIISHVATGEGRLEFAGKRWIRLQPTLVVGIILMAVSATIAAAADWGTIVGNYASSPVDYVKSVFLIDAITGTPAALSVTWTLLTEVVFYVLVWAILPMLGGRPYLSTVVLAASVFTINAALLGHAPKMITSTIFLPLLLMGRVAYLEWTGRIAVWVSWLSIAVIFGAFCLQVSVWDRSFLWYPGGEPILNYLLGFAIFYALMRLWPSNVSLLVFRFLANISYALYLVHLPVGITAMLAVTAAGGQFEIAFVVGTVLSIIAAAAIHYGVERPIQTWWRRRLPLAVTAAA